MMPNPGDVYIHHQFKFGNGSIGKKLFIVLNKPALTAPCLVLKTTSQSKRYANVNLGCNPTKRVFYVPKEWQKFEENTYVQLPEIFSIPTQEFIKFSMDKMIELKFSLTEECFGQLKNCLKRYFKNDISQEHQDMIFAKNVI